MTAGPAGFGCNTYSYTLSHSAPDCLRHLAKIGFREFEVMMYPGHFWPPDADAAAVKSFAATVKELGVRIVTLNMPNIDMNIAGASKEMRSYTLGLLKQIVQLAGELGASGVIVGTGKANPLFPAPRERLTGYFFEALDTLAPLARKNSTEIWVENMPFGFLPAIDEILAALNDYGDDKIGIVYDVANGHFIDEDIGLALRKCKPRLKLVHYSDTNNRVYRHDPVGLGTVPFEKVVPVLAEIGHREKPMLEIISPQADTDILTSIKALSALGIG
jgi:sugar phosphate isomerase/epimerase